MKQKKKTFSIIQYLYIYSIYKKPIFFMNFPSFTIEWNWGVLPG